MLDTLGVDESTVDVDECEGVILYGSAYMFEYMPKDLAHFSRISSASPLSWFKNC